MKRIPLRGRRRHPGACALVDDADFEWLNQWRWCLDSKGYAGRNEYLPRKGGRQRNRKIKMHRLILGLEPGDRRMGEHIDRNPLNCRRSNLRIAAGEADNKQNLGLSAVNTSGYRGVSWTSEGRKWKATVVLAGRHHHLGRHATPEQADAVVKAFRAEHMPFSEDATA